MTSGRNLLAICAASGFLMFSRAEAADELSHAIAAQPLAQALTDFALQTGLQLVYVSEIAGTQLSPGAPRGITFHNALERLLDGSGLSFEFLNDRAVRIFAASNCASVPGCGASIQGTTAADSPSRHPSSDRDVLDEVLVTGVRWWLDPAQA